MSLHLSYLTPVSVSQSGKRGKLCWHEINLGRIWGITTLDSSACVWVCVSALCQICWLTDTREKKGKSEESIPSHLDWRHDQRDWVSLRISHLFCLKSLVIFHQTVLNMRTLSFYVVIPDSHMLIIFYSLYSPVAWREPSIPLGCNYTPCEK